MLEEDRRNDEDEEMKSCSLHFALADVVFQQFRFVVNEISNNQQTHTEPGSAGNPEQRLWNEGDLHWKCVNR